MLRGALQEEIGFLETKPAISYGPSVQTRHAVVLIISFPTAYVGGETETERLRQTAATLFQE